MHQALVLLSLLCSLTLLAGCVPYPVYKTLQPAATLTVQDERGQPLSGVQVTLIANAYPYGFEKSRETKLSDANGRVQFSSHQEWRTETLMIHGAEVYFWNWCAEKAGYETFETHNSADGKMPEVETVVMKMGFGKTCQK